MNLQPIPLAALAEVHSGSGAPQDSSLFTESGHPFVRAGSLPKLLNGTAEKDLEKLKPAVAGRHKLKLFPAGTVLFAKSGMSATKGHIYRLRGPAYVVNHLAALIPRNAADSHFLVRALQRFSPTRLIQDPAYPSIRLSDIQSMEVLAPELKGRIRIAAILDQADALRRARRCALERLNDLGQSIFYEMFVADASNAWPMISVAEIAEKIRTGPFGSQLLHSEFTESGIAVLGIDNAVQNHFVWRERRFISEEKYKTLERYTVQPGDVLITIMGTCGRCAIVPEEIPLAINTKHLCCVTVDQLRIIPEYLHAAFLRHPDVRRQLGVSAKGAVMPGLNMGIIKQLEFPLPPLKLQMEFKARLSSLNEGTKLTERHFAYLEKLFASLQQRAFRGDL